mgnify:CR=1 FL=1
MKKIWLENPEAHDFPAAADYLDLLFEDQEVKRLVKKMQESPTIYKKAKDILRASNLSLLPKTNIHVKENLSKVKKGKKMSPILLVRDTPHLIIADGYHRICAIYYLSEDQEIPCRLV